MMTKTLTFLLGLVALMIILAGCSLGSRSDNPVPTGTAAGQETEAGAVADAVTPGTEVVPETGSPAASEGASKGEPVTDRELWDSPKIPPPQNELAGEYHWNQLLQRDAIYPIYEPEFASADQAPYEDEELVIGVEINGEAKAYAIGPLNGREMVNDTVGGTPVLVTW